MGASEQIAIGFDVGGTAIKSAVVRRNQSKVEIIAQERYPTDLIGSIEEFIEYLVGQCIAYRAVGMCRQSGLDFLLRGVVNGDSIPTAQYSMVERGAILPS